MTYYSYREQAAHYRQAARDRGCTCPDLPPHVHLTDCPLYEVPGGTPADFHDHHNHTVDNHTISPAADAPPPYGNPSGGAKPVSSTTETETEPREGQSAEDDAVEPSLGAGDMAEVDVTLKNPRVNFVAVMDENGVPIATWEREEDHAEERHSEGDCGAPMREVSA